MWLEKGTNFNMGTMSQKRAYYEFKLQLDKMITYCRVRKGA